MTAKKQDQPSAWKSFHQKLQGWDLYRNGERIFKFEAWGLHGGKSNKDTQRIAERMHPDYTYKDNSERRFQEFVEALDGQGKKHKNEKVK